MTEKTSPKLDWTELDKRAVDTVRVLAMDAVEKVGNGHPGTAMSLAPAAYLLFQKVMRHNPADPSWTGRDRFVLSAGHSSLTLYIQLYLAGYGLELDDLKSLRVWGSLTPGHPEHGHTKGVETTTGPLGQGVGNAVGMAMAARRERGLFDPETPKGESLFDHHVYVIASDGDLEEGVSSEASSLAAHQKLGNLTLIYDDNKISIEDDTNIAFSEDVAARYAAYGWDVRAVDWTNGGTGYEEDVQALYDAIEAGNAVTDKPSFIRLRTIIGWPAPNKQNTGKIHGSAIGADEVAATKEILGFDPAKDFEVADEVVEHSRLALERGKALEDEWAGKFEAWKQSSPSGRSCSTGCRGATCPPAGRKRCRAGTRMPRVSPPGPPPARCSPSWRRSCPSSGAVRPTWPARTTPPRKVSRRSSRPSTRPRSSRATSTAVSCTSASASTPWARS